MMDDTAVRKTEAQLTLWSRGDQKNARLGCLIPGREARFAAVLHVDELRVMLATARARFEALQADPTGKRVLLTSEFDDAWKELATAIGRRMPMP